MTDITTSLPLALSSPPDNWKYRRRFLIWLTAFCMAVVLIALLHPQTPVSVAEMAVMAAFGALVSMFGFYVAGASWDDHSVRQFQIQGLQALKGQTPAAGGQ